MKGFEEFIKIFGDATVLNAAELMLAFAFLYFTYKKVRDYLINVHESEKKRDEQLNEALEVVREFPEYRQKIVDIQEKLESEIQGLRASQQETSNRLVDMENATKRRERNKLRDRLLQNYRYYTNPKTNPSGTWTCMESEAFWELFRDYEDAGGNGYVHTEVLPAMERLIVVDVKKTY